MGVLDCGQKALEIMGAPACGQWLGHPRTAMIQTQRAFDFEYISQDQVVPGTQGPQNPQRKFRVMNRQCLQHTSSPALRAPALRASCSWAWGCRPCPERDSPPEETAVSGAAAFFFFCFAFCLGFFL